jgi:hypothetical protein
VYVIEPHRHPERIASAYPELHPAKTEGLRLFMYLEKPKDARLPLYPASLVGLASLCFVFNRMRSVPMFFGEPGSLPPFPARVICRGCYADAAAAGAEYSLTYSAPSPFADGPGPNGLAARNAGPAAYYSRDSEPPAV